MKIIYIHGFNSSGNSSKYHQLKNSFTDCNVLAPTLSADPVVALEQIKECIVIDPDKTILVGTSLGGFYAMITSFFYDIPCFLINPALKPHESLKDRVGHHTRYDGSNSYDFKREHLDTLEYLSYGYKKKWHDGSLIKVYVASDDDQLDFFSTRDVLPDKLNKFVQFPAGGHRFTEFHRIFPDIRRTIIEMQKEYEEKDYVLP